jgi:uncharacterized protein YuzE
MTFRLSRLAQDEMMRRSIPRHMVDAVLANPQQIIDTPRRQEDLPVADRLRRRSHLSTAGDCRRGRGSQSGRDGLPDQQDQQVLENAMKVTYDPEVDVLRIVFRDAPVEESDEDKPGVILDFDAGGEVIGVEILNASTRTDNPRSLDFAVLATS